MRYRLKQLGRKILPFFLANRPPLKPELWGFRYQDDQLYFNNFNLKDLSKDYGSPIHIVNEAQLELNLRRMTSSQEHLTCEIFYSYKTNPVPGILSFLHQRGVGAEVISHYEFWLARQLGVPPQKIIFNGPGKSSIAIEEAIDQEVLLYNFNHEEEIGVVQDILRRKKKKLRVGLRVSSANGWSGQFGIPMARALDLYRYLLNCPEFEVVGLHSHRGFLIDHQNTAIQYLDEIFGLLDRLVKELNFMPSILDLGGSLHVPTVRPFTRLDRRFAQTFMIEPPPPVPDQKILIEDYISLVIKKTLDFCQTNNQSVPRIILEPGRALTGNAQFLLSRVIGIRKESEFTYLILDAGSSITDPMKDEFHHMIPLERPQEPQVCYRVVGPICHMGDLVALCWRSGALKPGDAVAIMDSGAYFISEERAFSFPRSGIISISAQGEVKVIRRPEVFSDINNRDLVHLKA